MYQTCVVKYAKKSDQQQQLMEHLEEMQVIIDDIYNHDHRKAITNATRLLREVVSDIVMPLDKITTRMLHELQQGNNVVVGSYQYPTLLRDMYRFLKQPYEEGITMDMPDEMGLSVTNIQDKNVTIGRNPGRKGLYITFETDVNNAKPLYFVFDWVKQLIPSRMEQDRLVSTPHVMPLTRMLIEKKDV